MNLVNITLIMIGLIGILSLIRFVIAEGITWEEELLGLEQELIQNGYDWLVNYSDILIKSKSIYIYNIMYLSTYLKNEN